MVCIEMTSGNSWQNKTGVLQIRTYLFFICQFDPELLLGSKCVDHLPVEVFHGRNKFLFNGQHRQRCKAIPGHSISKKG
ncbi:unnamed protein product [Acanthoscelides obtectus]|uniref:Uncharacterized protein n=1 Tax=Acanthoscelides obtectus TaxID=200917 RepID=A0A9P0PV43_ACAOB|nr:unnamed protein product [Acanthoscelides obtectus]CAK1675874.1 hypothetical protein AOBTE_LOCUS30456 [Acanthoscelides obtectus]